MFNTKRILVICGDFYHSKEVIKRGLGSFLFEPEEYEIDYMVDAKASLTLEMLETYDLTMICKGNHVAPHDQGPWLEEGVTEVNAKEFEEYVRKGKGLMIIHAGLFFDKKSNTDYVELVGGIFVTHPQRCDVEIKVTSKHPIMNGVEDFMIRDEHYEIELCGENEGILFYTHSGVGGVQVGGYTKSIGTGRICVLTPGHIVEVWQNPMFQKLVSNSMEWCMNID